MSSAVFEIGYVSQVKTCFKQPFVVLSVTTAHSSRAKWEDYKHWIGTLGPGTQEHKDPRPEDPKS